MRSTLAARDFGATADFRWRGTEVSRLEGLTDAVLGFAITLIVVSLEVPKAFDELVGVMKGFLAFAVCFALLMQIWYGHYLFFRRYGLHDTWTILLNALLLFVVLFYVYPLKFLFTLWLGRTAGGGYGLSEPQARLLFTIYGLGFAAVFGVFGLLYLHAWRKRAVLELNEIERFDTGSAIVKNLLYVLVGGTSILVANVVPINWVSMAGWAYGLLGVVGFFHGLINGSRRERLIAQMDATAHEEAAEAEAVA